MSSVGYFYCACRDCLDMYVGRPGELCNDCEEYDCTPDGLSECERPDAYDGVEDAY